MRVLLLPGLVLLAVPWALAQDGDALHATACRQALAALQEREAAADVSAAEPAHQATLAQLKAARDHAARTCLQSRTDRPALPGRLAQPPMGAVPPPLATLPQLAPLPPPPAGISVPPLRIAPPVSITACDALGCWASDGTRLQRAGPNLLGPHGFCSAPAGVLHCP